MTYRVELSRNALHQLAGLPIPTRFALAEALSEITGNPYDPAITDPTDDPQIRRAIFDDGLGIVTYRIWDELLVIIAVSVTWVG